MARVGMDGAMLGGSPCRTGMSKGDASDTLAVQGLPLDATARSTHDMFSPFGSPLVVHNIRFCRSALIRFPENVLAATQAMDACSTHPDLRFDYVTKDMFTSILSEIEGTRKQHSRSPKRRAASPVRRIRSPGRRVVSSSKRGNSPSRQGVGHDYQREDDGCEVPCELHKIHSMMAERMRLKLLKDFQSADKIRVGVIGCASSGTLFALLIA